MRTRLCWGGTTKWWESILVARLKSKEKRYFIPFDLIHTWSIAYYFTETHFCQQTMFYIVNRTKFYIFELWKWFSVKIDKKQSHNRITRWLMTGNFWWSISRMRKRWKGSRSHKRLKKPKEDHRSHWRKRKKRKNIRKNRKKLSIPGSTQKILRRPHSLFSLSLIRKREWNLVKLTVTTFILETWLPSSQHPPISSVSTRKSIWFIRFISK